MSGVWALIPVKAPDRSKTRLGPLLQPTECAQLSVAMLTDVMRALENAKSIDEIALVTDDQSIAALALQAGHRVIDDESDDLCVGLNRAAKIVAGLGAKTIIILPGDIPTITAANIDTLVARHTGGLSICPAIRDGGTNALLCTPPAAVPFCYGKNSADRHLAAARKKGVSTSRLPVSAFFRDIDLPDDLIWLSNQTSADNTLSFLRRSGINARLKPAAIEGSL